MRRPILIVSVVVLLALLCGSSIAEEPSNLKLQEGFSLLKQGKGESAIETLAICTAETYSLSDYAQFGIAEAYFKGKKYPQALAAYQKVMEKYPQSALVPLSLLQAGKCYLQNKDFPRAEKIFHNIVGNYELSAAIKQASQLLEETLIAENPSQNQKAIARLEANLEEDSSETLKDLYNEAKEKRFKSKYATYYNQFYEATNYWLNNDYRRASTAFKKFSLRYPGMRLGKYAYFMYGRSELRRGQTKTAIKVFEKTLAQGGVGMAEAYYYLSFAYSYAGDDSSSLQSLEELVTLYPRSSYSEKAAYEIGTRHEKKNKINSAIIAYKRFLEKFPKSNLADDAAAKAGVLYYKAGKTTVAKGFLETALKTYPANDNSDQIAYWLGRCYEDLNATSEAISSYQTTMKIDAYGYYAHRAQLQLENYGIYSLKKEEKPKVELSLFKIKEAQDEDELAYIFDIWGALVKKADYSGRVSKEKLQSNPHYQKYQALFDLRLYKYAAIEAGEIARTQKVLLPLGQVLFAVGEFRGPAVLADSYIKKELINGNPQKIPSEVWYIAYPLAYWDEVSAYAKEHELDPFFILAVMREESYFGPQAVSRARAHGLMQIMPSTGKKLAEQLDIENFSNKKMFEPSTNIRMGSYYLSGLLKRFDGSEYLALAAYNGGPARVKKWVKQNSGDESVDIDIFVESIPLRETRNYVKKVMRSYFQYKRLYGENAG